MKKFILTLFLAAGVCWAGTAAELSAAQPAAETEAIVPENEAAVPQTHEDLSGEVIQEGGFLSGNSFAREQARTSALSDKKTQLQKLLLTGLSLSIGEISPHGFSVECPGL